MDFSILNKIPKQKLQLYAKKLLYSCDVEMGAQETADQLIFSGEGSFRLGPMASDVKINSQFNKVNGQLRFKNYKVELSRSGFYENYEMGDGVIYYSNSKGQDMEISINHQAFQDPLSFLFQVAHQGKESFDKAEIPLLIGKRIEKISWTKLDGIINLIKNSKVLGKIKEGADRIFIEIPKLKVKLELILKKQL